MSVHYTARTTRHKWLTVINRREYPQVKAVVLFDRLLLGLRWQAGRLDFIWRKVERIKPAPAGGEARP